ncbi:hypothetical protein HanRHA438_Chr08g0333131 [Helianthus annuus]|uniref:Uncharacterized protein n=1 Tax=Helianthus annuus TaxID=4232 RepID=A0A9K3GZE9_HELAN|nr:hypothetical protein HanXRQr2_Chr16g0767061 [Helianthus annuus]KAJ0495411.1 hypothetical protein HanIR_Chr12g0608471 [Helianthus annuus]KAJ0506952.1 hypothetical protein HanHA89_Chr12g0487831 [Helianthus annuus]KAJ0896292.1 hypothetical protein HanRHA438_Chr08g0333131 [Helianthus annuus]
MNSGATVTYGATVHFGMPEDDQAQRRTEHTIDTRFRTLLCCKF